MSTHLSTRLSSGLRPGRDLFRTLREEMDDMLGRFSTEINGDWPAGAIMPSVDLSENDSSVCLRMDLPGVKPDDVNIEILGDTLRISGERKEEKEDKGETWHRVERRSGSFHRIVTLPCAVDDSRAEAEYADGVLTVTLPKTPEARSRQVKIKAK